MKIGSMKALHIVLGLALFCAGAQNGQAQVARYDKTQAVGKRSFNYLEEDAQAQKTHKNKDIRIVFSDRDHNKAYAGPYAQRVLSEQKLAAPFYVIGEKNGFYKVVAADQSLLGQPKGMFAPLFNKRNHFKDAKSSPFVGWIDKNSVLEFSHSFMSKDNNFPIRYRIGASNVARLSNIKTFFTLDSLNLYSDPFFLEKSKGKLVAGQIVYAYKYDASKQAVLVSDRPSLSDSTRTALGWIPADLTAMVGQNHVYLLDASYPDFCGYPLGSNLLFTADGNWANTAADQKVAVNLPLSVWDRKKSVMVNVKGADVAVAEVDHLIEGSKNMNIHLVFFDKDRLLVRNLINALQGLKDKVSENAQVKFSLTVVSEKGNKHLSPTSDFGSWIDYLAKVTAPNTLRSTGGYTFHDAMQKIFAETPYVKFENNVFLILGTDEVLTFTSDINAEVYARSATLLIAQVLARDGMAYQDFILQSKMLLDNNISEYTNYSNDYLCEPRWSKNGSFKDMSTDSENVYLLDAPKNSSVAGGFIYPKLYSELSGTALSTVLDSLFLQLAERNNELVNISRSSENRYGMLRAVPTAEVVSLCDSSAVSVSDLEKSNINDLMFKKMWCTPQQLSTYDEGYLFDAAEMQNILEGYRDLMPYLSADTLGNQELAVLRKNYKRQCKLVNMLSYRKALKSKSSISRVYYHRVSVPSSDALNYIVRIKDIRRKKCDESEWDKAYKEMFNRMVELEKLFKTGRLKTISVAGKPYYFIPVKMLP